MSERVFLGFIDLTGAQIGTLKVISLAGRNPVRWQVKCAACGSQYVDRHENIVNGTGCKGACRNAVKVSQPQTFAEFLREARSREEQQRQRATGPDLTEDQIRLYRNAIG